MAGDHNLSFLQKYFKVVLNKKYYLSPGLHKTISDERSKTTVHHMGNGEDVNDTRHDSALLSINQSEPRPRAMNFWPLLCPWWSGGGSSQQSYCNISTGLQSENRAACRPSPSWKISFNTRLKLSLEGILFEPATSDRELISRQNLPYHCIDGSYHRVPFTINIMISQVKSYNLILKFLMKT